MRAETPRVIFEYYQASKLVYSNKLVGIFITEYIVFIFDLVSFNHLNIGNNGVMDIFSYFYQISHKFSLR